MRNCYLVLVILMVSFSQGSLSAAEHVGVRKATSVSSVHTHPVEFTIWYPADVGGVNVEIGASPFFEGTYAFSDAPIKGGKYPLVLLSHGAGLSGRADAFSWLATGIAEQGYIVVAPTHPRNSGPDRSALETIKIWLRPTDISDVLNAVEQDDVLQNRIDWPAVGVVGASMGGTTALLLAGMRIDSKKLAGYCDDLTTNPSLCGWMMASGVNLHSLDLEPSELDYAEPRIKFAIALDPAPVDVLADLSVASPNIPVNVVNFGTAKSLLKTVDASHLAAGSKDITYSLIEDGSHFSLFGLCRKGAPEMAIAMEIDEPICEDGKGRSRSEIHQEVILRVTSALDGVLRNKKL